jgi:hypothetical protein
MNGAKVRETWQIITEEQFSQVKTPVPKPRPATSLWRWKKSK